MTAIGRIYRNGSSSVVTVPAEMLRALKWHRGDELIIRIDAGALWISKWPMLPSLEAQRHMFRAKGAKRPKA